MTTKDYFVYLFKNTINGKVYIGQTKNLKKRCSEGNYRSSPYFYSAIQKYGWEKFSHSILKKGLSLEEADYWEVYYIKEYQSTNPSYGYNLSQGGGHKCVLFGEKNGFYNKKHTAETIEILRSKARGGNNPNAKKVICLTTNEEFPSCAEAADWCGIARQNINRCCRGGRPTAGKHPITKESLRWRYKEDNENEV